MQLGHCGVKAQRSPRQGLPLAPGIRSTARPTSRRLLACPRLRMALDLCVPGRYSIFTTAMTTAMPSPGQATVDSDAVHDNCWRDQVGIMGLFPGGLRASE